MRYSYNGDVTFLWENGKYDPCKIKILELFDTQFVRIDYVDEGTFPNSVKIRSRGPSGQ